MKTLKRWEDIKGKNPHMTPERMARLDREVEQTLVDMDLRAIRELTGKSQAEVAAVAEVSQAEVSRTEKREDHKLSTLKRYVEALGGELEVCAVFGDKRVRLRAV
jgi:hypothetical protein